MNDNLSSQLAALKQFNLWVRRQLELAEATIPILNDQIAQLTRTGLLADEAVLGDVIYKRGYSNPGASDGSMLVQAAVLVPGGFGLVEWDSEEYLTTGRSALARAIDARTRFREFDHLEPAFKALLLAQVEYLFGRLLAIAFPRQSEPPPAVSSWTTNPA